MHNPQLNVAQYGYRSPSPNQNINSTVKIYQTKQNSIPTNQKQNQHTKRIKIDDNKNQI